MTNQTLIKIDNVRKSYAGGFEALKGINLEINRRDGRAATSWGQRPEQYHATRADRSSLCCE